MASPTMPAMQLPWISPGDRLPAPSQAWGEASAAPGLVAVGGELSVARLQEAYAQAIFPWFSDGQPILWWSPDPRMVLSVVEFRLHRSLRRTLRRFAADAACEIRIDHDFETVIRACAASPRAQQDGTWIVEPMVRAYTDLHRAGFAHSVETWINGELHGGLYCVGMGHAVFGESMFASSTDASKIALSALVAWSRHHGIHLVDCQQNTRHLASLGAREIPRAAFVEHVAQALQQADPPWKFNPVYWKELLAT